ncbi:MAG TPA: hypothetical protein P5161_01780 [Eubacteriales bacterium]|nr:hypothetical protein [Clostridia bacterium]HRR89494.1 hypothetical protein [Eubacteriales bacterium]HRU83958.1 hypothetical protein [Eubacteriales bacterium]
MKIRMKLKPFQIAMLAAVTAVTAAAIVLDSLILAEAGKFVNSNPALTVLSICCSALIMAVCILVFLGSFYYFGDGALKICLAFLPSKVNYDDVEALRLDSVGNRLVLIYKDKKSTRDDGLSSFEFLIASAKFSAVQEFLVKKGIIYEIFESSKPKES